MVYLLKDSFWAYILLALEHWMEIIDRSLNEIFGKNILVVSFT